MRGSDGPASLRGSRRFGKTLAWGMAASLALHSVAVLAWRAEAGRGPFTGAVGPRAYDSAPAPGDDALEVVNVAAPRAAIEVPPPPTWRPDLDHPELRELVVQDPGLAGRARLTSLVPGSTATGLGDAGSDEGTFRRTLPVPRVIIPEWNAPKQLRGVPIPVRVLVGEDGSTLRVELPEPTPDDRFNRRLLRTYGEMDWIPATRGGRPVREWTQIVLIP